jgi:hypothetical protein
MLKCQLNSVLRATLAKIAAVCSNAASGGFPVWTNFLLKVSTLLDVSPIEENPTPPAA